MLLLHTDCTTIIRNDTIYEGVEYFLLKLGNSPEDPRVVITDDKSSAKIYIHDDQDGEWALSFIEISAKIEN